MCKECKKLKTELTALREFKKKHDLQLKRLIGSPTWHALNGRITIGYVQNFHNSNAEVSLRGIKGTKL